MEGMSLDYLIISVSEPDSGIWGWLGVNWRSVVPVVALIVTISVAVNSYASTERRNKNEIVRNAITDLSTGNVAQSRNSVTKWATGDDSWHNYWSDEYIHEYFELCWAYQRGDTARSVWRTNWFARSFRFVFGRAYGREHLQFHLEQIAVSAHQFHNHLLARNDDELIEDSHIWEVVGEKLRKDVVVFGIKNPDSNASYREYFERIANERKAKSQNISKSD